MLPQVTSSICRVLGRYSYMSYAVVDHGRPMFPRFRPLVVYVRMYVVGARPAVCDASHGWTTGFSVVSVLN